MITKTVDEYGTIRHHNELGEYHNEGDLPALIFKNCSVNYCKNGQNHRLAGPAWIFPSGIVQYWIHGEFLAKEEFDNHPLVREYRLKKVVEGLLHNMEGDISLV